MTDQIRRFKWIFEGDGDDLAIETQKAIANAERLEDKMKSLNRASRAEATLARDALVGAATATNDKLNQLMERRRDLEKVHYEARANLIRKAEADTKRELGIERQAIEARLANAKRLLEAKTAANARINADQTKTTRRIVALDKEQEQAARALMRVRQEQAALDTKIAAQSGLTPRSRDIRGSLYQQKSLASSAEAKLVAEQEVRIKELAELKKVAIVQEALQTEKALSLKSVQDKHAGYTKDLANFKGTEKAKVAEAVKDAELIAAADKAAAIQRLDAEIAMYRGMKNESSAYAQQVSRTSSEIIANHNRQLSGLRALGQGITAAGQSMTRFGVMSTLALSAPIGLFIKSGFEFNKMKENAENAFISLTGNAGKAKEVMAQLYEFAKPTAFEFKNVVESAARLSNVGFKTEQLLPVLQRIAALSALAQVSGADPAQVIKQTTEIIAKIEARGNITKQQLSTLDRLIGFSKIYLNSLGIENITLADRERLYDAIRKRQISSASVFSVLFAAIDEKAGGLLERQKQSFSGLMANVSDTFHQLSGEVLAHLFDDAKAAAAKLIPMMEKMKNYIVEMDPKVRRMVELALVLAVVFGPVVIVLGQITTMIGGIVTAISLLKIAFSGFSIASGGVVAGGLADTLLGGIGTAVTAAKAAITGFVAWFWGIVPAIGAFFAGLGPMVAEALLSVAGIFSAGFMPTILAGLTAIGSAVVTAAATFAEFAIPIALVLTLIVGFARAVVVHWDSIKQGFVKAWDTIVEYYFANVKAPLEASVTSVKDFFVAAYYTVTDVFVQTFGEVIAWFEQNWPIVKEAVINVMDGVVNVIKAAVIAVYAVWYVFGPTIVAIVTSIWEQLKIIISTGTRFVLELFGAVSALIAGDWDKFWEYLGRATKVGMEFLLKMSLAMAKALFAVVKGIALTITRIIGALFVGLWEVVKAGFKKLYDFVSSGPMGIVQAFLSLGQRAIEAFKQGLMGSTPTIAIRQEYVPSKEMSGADEMAYQNQRARAASQPAYAGPAGDPNGPTGFEGDAAHPDLSAGGGGGKKKMDDMRESVDRAAQAVANLRHEVEKMNLASGLNGKAFDDNIERAKKLKAAYEAMTDKTSYWLGKTDAEISQAKIMKKEYLELSHSMTRFADAVGRKRGVGSFVEDYAQVDSDAKKMVEDFHRQYVEIWKNNAAMRGQAELKAAEYSVQVELWRKEKKLAIQKKEAEEIFAFTRRIADINRENTNAEAQYKIESANDQLEDFTREQEAKFRGDYRMELEAAIRVLKLKQTLQASYDRWRLEKQKELDRALLDAQMAASSGSVEIEKLAIERQVEEFKKSQRSMLITKYSTFEEILELEGKLALYQNAVWEAYNNKRAKEDEQLARQRRDERVALIYDELQKTQAIQANLFSDTFNAGIDKYGKSIGGIAKAWKEAEDALNQYNFVQRQQLENELRSQFNAVLTPKQRLDPAEQAKIDAAVTKAAVIMQRYGYTIQYVRDMMNGVPFAAESFLAALAKLEQGLVPTRSLMEQFTDSMKAAAEQALQTAIQITTNFIPNIFSAIGDSLGKALAGTEKFGESLKKATFALLGELASAWGRYFILLGAGMLFTNPAGGIALIAAGIALTALGSYLNAKGQAVGQASTAASSAAGADSSASTTAANDSRERIDRARFDTFGPHVITIKFDTRNVNKGMKQMLSGASAKAARDARRRTRQQLIDSLG